MLSREVGQRVRQHLRLARGLLDTVVLVEKSSEFEERNALSRGYYAVFHASSALVLSRDIEPSKSHGGLGTQVGRHLGKSFARFVTDTYELRRKADYAPEWRPIRHVSDSKLKSVWTNVLWACVEAEKRLSE